jgi:hypothetical protein
MEQSGLRLRVMPKSASGISDLALVWRKQLLVRLRVRAWRRSVCPRRLSRATGSGIFRGRRPPLVLWWCELRGLRGHHPRPYSNSPANSRAGWSQTPDRFAGGHPSRSQTAACYRPLTSTAKKMCQRAAQLSNRGERDMPRSCRLRLFHRNWRTGWSCITRTVCVL